MILNKHGIDAGMEAMTIEGHPQTVRRLYETMKKQRPGMLVITQEVSYMPKRHVMVGIGGNRTLVVVTPPDYPDKGGTGAKRKRKRRQ